LGYVRPEKRKVGQVIGLDRTKITVPLANH
jgi:hypothetical protein